VRKKAFQLVPMSAFASHCHRAFRWREISRCTIILGAALLLSACNKSKPADEAVTAQPQPVASTNQNRLPVISPPAASLPPIDGNLDGGANLRQLNHAYLRWIAQNHRRPASYENFIELSGLQVPPAPSGKKYVIDKNGFIALGNNP
jgi:hypothetical protein